MSEDKKFKVGDKVRFLPGPRSRTEVVAKVIQVVEPDAPGKGRSTMLLTKDANGDERRIRPGHCTIAP